MVDGADLLYNTRSPSDDDEEVLKDYLRLDVSCLALYSEWSLKDENFSSKVGPVSGLRLLRQDPVEALIAFICSSNNNVSRISGMLNRMCEAFGVPLGDVAAERFYAFPSLNVLAEEGTESTLRRLGFGYRAGYVHRAASTIVHELGGEKWLRSLRTEPYSVAWSQLQALAGVGPKVADCVCLMALDKMEAVPLDTHVLRMAERDYGMAKRGKGVSAEHYRKVGDAFRSIFGDKAGWAQAVLFSVELQKSLRSHHRDQQYVT